MKRLQVLMLIVLSVSFLTFGCRASLAQQNGQVETQLKPLVISNETNPVNSIDSLQVTVEDDVRYVSIQTSREAPYRSIDELEIATEFIFTGECISYKSIFQNDTLYTLSGVRISQVFKGELRVGDTV